MITAKLTESRWLVRVFNVITSEGLFEVVYYGIGNGYEEVWVNGEVVCHKKTYLWYAPEFEFSIGTLAAKIRIRVWAWLAVRSFTLEIGGQRIYFEGKIE